VNGKINLPLGADPIPAITYDAKACLVVRPTPVLTLGAEGQVNGTVGQPATWLFSPSLSYRFAEPWTLSATGSVGGVGALPPDLAAALGLTFEPSDNLYLSAGGGVGWSPVGQPAVNARLTVTYRR
jgi:hypothetical protein